MTEDAPYATDHDDDSKRLASSYSYDLPNQEPNQNDNDGSFVPPNLEYHIKRLYAKSFFLLTSFRFLPFSLYWYYPDMQYFPLEIFLDAL
jgi:hypothetical protein